MSTVIVGATRGLGASLATQYAANSSSTTVYGTSRQSAPASHNSNTHWIGNVDIGTATAGPSIVRALRQNNTPTVDVLIIVAGYFATETLAAPKWDAEVAMYTTSAIGPVFVVSALAEAEMLARGAKVVLVSSESGSIALRHEKEGGGNYGHHASKAAVNMVGRLLALDLREKGVAVGSVHPGFMRTDMTKGVGFDKFWDEGGGESCLGFDG
jgi:NAD(P)-dependent dehydrogenase (short-subunit alcohol dehydrogenase family)